MLTGDFIHVEAAGNIMKEIKFLKNKRSNKKFSYDIYQVNCYLFSFAMPLIQ